MLINIFSRQTPHQALFSGVLEDQIVDLSFLISEFIHKNFQPFFAVLSFVLKYY